MKYVEDQIITGGKDYNTKTKIVFEDMELVNKWWVEYVDSARNLSSRNIHPSFKELLRDLYMNGYGFKIISNSIENASYTQIRGLVNYLFPDIVRTGRDVVTDKTKILRSERLINSDDNPWKYLDNKNSTGIQGRYKDYWLRSTYEYIYVKWMEKHNVEFKSEPNKFKLSNGEWYTPDFGIYENGVLIKYVETKGKVFMNNIHKPKLLEEQIDIPVVIIDDINPYCERNYRTSLKEWKEHLNNTNQIVERKGIKNRNEN